MEQAPSNTIEPRPRWRFSLRTAMVALFVGCILLGISAIVGPRVFITFAALAIPISALFTLIFGCATCRGKWVALSGALLVLTFVLGSIVWVPQYSGGPRSVPITFTVVDAHSGIPIPNAQLTWEDRFYATTQSSIPGDKQGRVTFMRDFQSSSIEFFAGEVSRIDYSSQLIRVTAPGYAPVSFRLAERIGLGQDLADPLPGPIRVEMQPGDDSTAPEDDPLREDFLP